MQHEPHILVQRLEFPCEVIMYVRGVAELRERPPVRVEVFRATLRHDILHKLPKRDVMAVLERLPGRFMAELAHDSAAVLEVEMHVVVCDGGELVPVGGEQALERVSHHHELEVMFEPVLDAVDVVAGEVTQPQRLQVVLVVDVHLAVGGAPREPAQFGDDALHRGAADLRDRAVQNLSSNTSVTLVSAVVFTKRSAH